MALKKEFFDKLETRAPKRREAALMTELPRLVAHAKKRAPGFARIFSEVNPSTIRTRAALAKLPVTRKSDLGPLQKEMPPLGSARVSAAV